MIKRIVIVLLLVILALPAAGLFYLLYSEHGLNLVLSQLDRFGKLSIRVDGATGRLAGPLNIRRFELNLERMHIVVENMHADLNPRALLAGVLEVSAFTANGVDVRVQRGAAESARPPRFLPGNLRVNARNVRLSAVKFVYADRPFTADTLTGEAVISRQRLTVRGLHVTSPEYEFDAEVDLRARQSIELDITADGRYTLRGNALHGHAELKGVPALLQAQARLTAPSPLDVSARMEFPGGPWSISGEASSPAFDLKPWWRQAPFALRDARLQYSVGPQVLRVDGELAIPELGTESLRVAAEGSYGQQVLRIRNAQVATQSGAAQVNATGEVRFGENATLDAHARWRGLRWPLAAQSAAALIASDRGELDLSGDLPYQFSLRADLGSSRWPAVGAAQLAAQGVVTKDSLTVSQYQVAMLDGSIAGDAQLAFAKPQTWSLRAEARDLNPTAIRSELPGNLAVRAAAQGRGFDRNASFSAQITALTGTLRNRNLRGRGVVEYASRAWRARQVELSFGSTRLSADGTLGRQLAVNAELRSGDLRDLDIGGWSLTGQADVRLQAQGSLAAPRLIAQASSAEFTFGEWQARKLSLDGDVDLSNARSSRLDVSAARIVRGGYALDAPHVVADGLLTGHHIEISSGVGTTKSSAATVNAELDGAYAQGRWSGTLAGITLVDAERRERVRVLQPVAMRVSAAQAEVDELCFAFDDSRNCAQGRWQRRGPWRVVASVNRFPLAILNSGRAESLRYEGHLAANIDLGAGAGEPWQGRASAELVDASIAYFSSAGRYEALPIGTARLDLAAAERKLTGTLTINAGESTRIDASAELAQNPARLITHWPLQAQIRLHSMDAKLLPLLVADVDRFGGTLDADMRVTGSMAQPRLAGTLQLQQGEVDSYQINLALRETNVIAKLDDNRLQIEGGARAGEGTLDVRGSFAWRDRKPSGSLQLKGEQLLVADLPEYRVVASPDLYFSVAGTHVDVVGDILIPSARLQPQNVSGAVQTSADARLLTDQALTQGNRWTISSEVRVSMGDDVRVDALGLQGRLTGSVGTTFQPGNPAIGRGELSIQNGLYEAYGRKLDLTRGRLLFEASPLDDPGLDAQAERKIEDTTVGVNVRGTLRAPRLQFYSDPSMSQTEIVSYLLIGKPLDELQGSETTTVKSASNTLAVQGGGYVAAQLGRRIGLEQVGVETDDDNQSALVLGKFLSPRLFVSYGISLTQAINTLKLRYTINDHWLLKTESGNAQSADIEFKIER